MKLRFSKWFGILLVIILLVGGYSIFRAKEVGLTKSEINISAATSLVPYLKEVKREYENEHPTIKLIINSAGSQILKTQIEQGSKADLFISARKKDVDSLVAKRFAKSVDHLASNELVIVVNKEGANKVHAPVDIARRGVRLVMGEENSPIGDYSRKMLKKMDQSGNFGEDFINKALANLVSNESGEQNIVTKVLLGEAEAGIVYRSSASLNEGNKVDGLIWIPIDSQYNVRTDSYLVQLNGASKHATEYAKWLLSNRGKKFLQKHGYII